MSEVSKPAQIIAKAMECVSDYPPGVIDDFAVEAVRSLRSAGFMADEPAAPEPGARPWKVRGDNGDEFKVTCTREVADEIAECCNLMAGSSTYWDAVEIEGGE